MALWALVKKEWLLLLRDWHALLLLFAMPAAFILVMSLAMQHGFSVQRTVSIHYFLLDQHHSAASAALVKQLASAQGFQALPADAPPSQLLARVHRDQVQFLVEIPRGFGDAMQSADPVAVRMRAGPGVEPAVYRLFEMSLRSALSQVYLGVKLAPLKAHLPPGDAAVDFTVPDKLLQAESLYQENGAHRIPTSVQQSVPAWLLFAMFFIAIPLSTTWVQERQQGTYARLRSMGVNASSLLLGKLLPYVAINLCRDTAAPTRRAWRQSGRHAHVPAPGPPPRARCRW